MGLWLLALGIIATGIVGLVFPAIPGPPLLFAGLWMAAWMEDFYHVGFWTLTILALLGAAAQIADFIAGALGAKKFGASQKAVWMSILGAFVGIFFGIIGLILGPFIGAMIGELSSGRNLQQAGNAGVGATVGLILGTAAKIAFGIAMLSIFAFVRLV
nr:DUF456 domain-containing protein [Oceanococcus sp. HetDA_MAG_MS8]